MPEENSTTASVPITVTPAGLAALQLYHQEISTYLRELPRLLQEGQAWRYTLVKGNEVLGIWDEQAKAIEVGRDRFGLAPIYIKKIDPRDPELYNLLKAH